MGSKISTLLRPFGLCATTHPQKVMNLLNFHEFPLCTVVQLSNSTESYLFLNEVYWSLFVDLISRLKIQDSGLQTLLFLVISCWSFVVSRSHSALLCQACSKGWPRLSSFKDWRPRKDVGMWGFVPGRSMNVAFWMEESWFREDSNTTVQEILVSWYVCWICNIHRDQGERERECFFLLGGHSSNFPGHKTQGAHCVRQYSLGRTCFDSLPYRSWWFWLSSDGLLLSIQVFERG